MEIHLVVEGWLHGVVEHLLVEYRAEATGHRGNDPHPVGWTTASQPVLLLHVNHERLGCRGMVSDGHSGFLSKQKKANLYSRLALCASIPSIFHKKELCIAIKQSTYLWSLDPQCRLVYSNVILVLS